MKGRTPAVVGGLGLLILACSNSSSNDGSSTDGGATGTSNALSFHGTEGPFPGFSYDTGALPAGSPVTVDLSLSVGGSLTADAQATAGGDTKNPTVAGTAGTGKFVLDVHFKLGGQLHAALSGVPSYDGPIPGIENLDIAFGGTTTFDPFLVGMDAPVTAMIPETALPSIPLPGGIPGDLNITIATGSTMTSTFHGVCAGVADDVASYTAQTTSTASILLDAAIVIHVPVLGDKTIMIPSFTVNVPAVTQALDMGTAPAKGGGAAPKGTSIAQTGGCAPVPDGGAIVSNEAGAAGDDGGTGTGPSGDGGSGLGDGGACSPGTAPTQFAFHPPVNGRGSCTAAQITSFIADCGEGGSKAPCDAWRADAANGTCESCAETPITAANWGATVTDRATGFEFPNMDGCLAALAPDQTPCAENGQDAYQCDFAACDSTCLALGSSFANYTACIDTSDTTVCSTFSDAATACRTAVEADGGSVFTTCYGGTTFDESVQAVATALCGP